MKEEKEKDLWTVRAPVEEDGTTKCSFDTESIVLTAILRRGKLIVPFSIFQQCYLSTHLYKPILDPDQNAQQTKHSHSALRVHRG